MNWPSPGNDPWYAANPTDNNARRTYYSVNATPTHIVDGASASGQSGVTTRYNSRRVVASPVWLSITSRMNPSGTGIDVTVKAVAEQAISGNYRLRIAQVEIHETWTTPAPNGQTSFHFPMVQFAPNANGFAFTHSGSTSDTLTFNATFPLRTTGPQPYTVDNCAFVAFVQNESTREIVQAKYERFPLDFPNLVYQTHTATDVTGNMDGRIDPGENGAIRVTIRNLQYFETATNVVGTLRTAVAGISMIDSTANFGNIPQNTSANNNADPFIIQVAPNTPVQWANFTLVAVTDSGHSFQLPFQVRIGRPPLLIVQSDSTLDFKNFYISALDSLGLEYDWWDADVDFLTHAEFQRYQKAIWFTGMKTVDVFTEWDKIQITNFINAGKDIILSSQNGLEDALQTNVAFVENVLRANMVMPDISNYVMNGVAGDPYFDQLTVRTAGAGGAGNCDNPTVVTPRSNSTGMLRYNNRTDFGGVYYENGTSRVVFLAFPLEAVSGASNSTSRTTFFSRLFQYIDGVTSTPEAPSVNMPNQFQIHSVYPNPFNHSTTVSLTLPKTSTIVSVVYDVNGREVYSNVRTFPAGNHRYTLDLSKEAGGVYFLKVSQGNEHRWMKLVFLK
ncbi:MAG: T9SS type A sorting domain-containing protein [bacterium]|nr:T9SS type A sorting domain-containing protein [bacterium]